MTISSDTTDPVCVIISAALNRIIEIRFTSKHATDLVMPTTLEAQKHEMTQLYYDYFTFPVTLPQDFCHPHSVTDLLDSVCRPSSKHNSVWCKQTHHDLCYLRDDTDHMCGSSLDDRFDKNAKLILSSPLKDINHFVFGQRQLQNKFWNCIIIKLHFTRSNLLMYKLI